MTIPRPPPADSNKPHPDLNHFLAIPCIRSLITSPTITILPPIRCRELKESTEDQLFADTFATPDTIKAMLSFHTSQPSQPRLIPIVSTLFDLGVRLNGYAGVVHGGVVVTIMDESMGIFLSRNQERGAFSPDGSPTMGENGSGDVMTGELKVKFLRPVKTPGVVRVDVHMGRVEGRKYVVEAEMTDCEGVKVASGEALWIAMRPKPSL